MVHQWKASQQEVLLRCKISVDCEFLMMALMILGRGERSSVGTVSASGLLIAIPLFVNLDL